MAKTEYRFVVDFDPWEYEDPNGSSGWSLQIKIGDELLMSIPMTEVGMASLHKQMSTELHRMICIHSQKGKKK